VEPGCVVHGLDFGAEKPFDVLDSLISAHDTSE
jgi:hypothetical protein